MTIRLLRNIRLSGADTPLGTRVDNSTMARADQARLVSDGVAAWTGDDQHYPDTWAAGLGMGDSLVARERSDSATEVADVAYGAINHANVLSGGKFRLGQNLGVTGYTLEQIADQVPDALRYARNARFVLFSGGSNNIYTDGRDRDYVTARLGPLLDVMGDQGIPLIAYDMTPRSGATTTEALTALRINDWMHERAARRRGFYVFAASKYITDYSSAAYAPASGVLASGSSVHWNNSGAYLLGAGFNSDFGGLFLPTARLPVSAADTYAVDSASGQVWSNPFFTGSSGSKSATGGGAAPTGNVATSVTVDKVAHNASSSSTCACTVEARADGFGNNQRIVVASALSGDSYIIRCTGNLSSGLSPGDLVELELETALSSHSAVSGLSAFLQMQTDSGTIRYCYAMRHDAANVAHHASFAGGHYRTRRHHIPAGSAITAFQFRIALTFNGAGGATLDVGRLNIRNLTRAGLEYP